MVASDYVPTALEWARCAPQEAALDAVELENLVDAVRGADIGWPADPSVAIRALTETEGPAGELVGPFRARGGTAGILLFRGKILAEWGDTGRVDMRFSVAKSFVSLLAGVALRDGLIRDVDDPVRQYVHDRGFDSAHNQTITWRHLLQQTSEWEGELFGKPDSVDRNRSTGSAPSGGPRGERALKEPGTFWEYNDVRVNRLSLALLRLFREPLPNVLAREIASPLAMSETWEWHGYRTSIVEVDGRPMVSVPGGGHWGGGLWMSVRDMARVGLLMQRRGAWGSRDILPPHYVDAATTPCPLNPSYGYLWWLNTDRRILPNASAQSYFAIGGGGNMIWVDPQSDIVGAFAWTKHDAIDRTAGFIGAGA